MSKRKAGYFIQGTKIFKRDQLAGSSSIASFPDREMGDWFFSCYKQRDYLVEQNQRLEQHLDKLQQLLDGVMEAINERP